MGIFKKTAKKNESGDAQQTRFGGRLKRFFKRNKLDENFWKDFEELLLTSDVGLEMTERIIQTLIREKTLDDVKERFQALITDLIKPHKIEIRDRPYIIMVVGVNGTGKTTSIAKLAHQFKKDGKSVLLVAADTFRAAAIDQLKLWGDRLDIPVVAQKPESDPAAVVYDGIKSGLGKSKDIVILDTAGRLHTNKNLMEELKKVKRVASKAMPNAPHDTILVLDASVGQNGLSQAAAFNEALGVDAAIIAKMDGTAKGGVMLSIAGELGLPVSYMGTGETVEDLKEFDPKEFAASVFE